MSQNIVWQSAIVDRHMREALNAHPSYVLWFTGLSGAGKSTLAHSVEYALFKMGCRTYVLDGDNVRHGLCSDLSFSIKDRVENIRRIGELSNLFMDSGIIAITAFISPLRSDRDQARSLMRAGDFIEIYCDAALSVCETRDVKGLYQKARSGLIADFTGISSPYEPPVSPELVVKTGEWPLEKCVDEVLNYLRKVGKLNPGLCK